MVEDVAAAWTSLLSNEAITQMVGHEAFARALVAARGGHVHDVELDEQNLVVSGRVKGTYRDDYAVRVYLASSRSGTVTAYRSQCTCPVVVDCKHAAAVLIVARHLAATPAVERPAWEKTLDKLVAGPPPAEVEIAPLACEFGVEQIPAFRGYAGRQDLRIRPVRLGKGGHWVRSGIGWDDLDFVARSYVPEHRELLLQFRAAAGSSARYTLPRSAWLSLSTVGSGFWGLLDQAAAAGLALITASPLSGPVRTESRAQVQLDAHRADDGGLQLRPRVVVEDRPLPAGALGVIGEPAHGVFWRQPGADGTEEICLARLETLLSRELRHLLVEERAVHGSRGRRAPVLGRVRAVPAPARAADVHRRVGRGCPTPSRRRWRSRCPSGPTTAYGWTGRPGTPRGGRPKTFALDEPPAARSIRDPAAEQELVAGLGLPSAERPDRAGRPRGAAVRRAPGAGARRPRGGRRAVGRGGRLPADHRRSADPGRRDPPAPGHRLVRPPGQRDDRRRGGAVRRAVRRPGPGEEYLVLETGVYFDLDRPEFTALRELITESQALVDRPHPELSINRFQTSLWEDLAALGAEIDQSVQWNAAVRRLAGTTAIDDDPLRSS